VPSPFLLGGFDKLIAANPNESWIGLWETNRGCPFQCTFCDWGSATAAKVTSLGSIASMPRSTGLPRKGRIHILLRRQFRDPEA